MSLHRLSEFRASHIIQEVAGKGGKAKSTALLLPPTMAGVTPREERWLFPGVGRDGLIRSERTRGAEASRDNHICAGQLRTMPPKWRQC